MRLLLALTFAALLAGCATPSDTVGVAEADEVALTIVDARRAPQAIELRITNTGQSDMMVVHGDFKIVDANGTVFPVNDQATFWTGNQALPNYITLGPGESAQGYLAFAVPDSGAPYTLRYKGDGGRAASVPVE